MYTCESMNNVKQVLQVASSSLPISTLMQCSPSHFLMVVMVLRSMALSRLILIYVKEFGSQVVDTSSVAPSLDTIFPQVTDWWNF